MRAADVVLDRYDLTPTQRRVWALRLAGYGNDEIASACWMSVKTVEMHLANAAIRNDAVQGEWGWSALLRRMRAELAEIDVVAA